MARDTWPPDTSNYETLRAERIARNRALIKELELDNAKVKLAPNHDKADSQRRRRQQLQQRRKPKGRAAQQPMRASARIAAIESQPTYQEDGANVEAAPRRRTTQPSAPATQAVKAQKPAVDVDRLREQWTAWTPTAGPPQRDDGGTFHFESNSDFEPNKSPAEMLREGVFGGSYFRPLHSARLDCTVADDWRELPAAWTQGLDAARSLTRSSYAAAVNKYGVACGQSIEQWEANGWIEHEYDVRGWFQWYCRFFQGRRCDDDGRQISRWKKCVGDTGRWRRALVKKYVQAGIRSVNDEADDEVEGVSPAIHQTCLHWAWELKQDVLDEAWEG